MLILYKKIPLWQKIFCGLILGLIVGLIFKEDALIFKPLGTLFLNLIKMLIVPLIFVTLISGITSMDDLSKMKRVGLKTFFIYIGTTSIAISIGLLFGYVFKPGVDVAISSQESIKTSNEALSLVDTLLNIIPTNPVLSLAEGNILQIILFAIILGISINLAGEKGKIVF